MQYYLDGTVEISCVLESLSCVPHEDYLSGSFREVVVAERCMVFPGQS